MAGSHERFDRFDADFEREFDDSHHDYERESRYEDEFEDKPLVRPFMVTGGRTETNLALEAMVVDVQQGKASIPQGTEYQLLYELCANPQAVAELSARASMPLGVVRILLSDLISGGALVLAEAGTPGMDDLDFIDRIIGAIERL
ncbi:MAG: DUF742 domain-containing protein [Acidimicrobiales bacterium]